MTYRALQRQFGLDEAYLADLKAEIIEAQRLAIDENGTVLVWTNGWGLPTLSLSAAQGKTGAEACGGPRMTLQGAAAWGITDAGCGTAVLGRGASRLQLLDESSMLRRA